jgi:hypothetical protein
MLTGNRCEHCGFVIDPPRALHKQTKYHEECAREMKRRNTLAYWTRAERKAYMCEYMKRYRQRRKDKETAKTIDTGFQVNKSLDQITGNGTRGTYAIGVSLVMSPFLWGTVTQFSFESVLSVLRGNTSAKFGKNNKVLCSVNQAGAAALED